MDLVVWCLLCVQIEDVIVVDGIFIIFMGDDVELWWVFIELNVLWVGNIDV